MNAQPTVTLTGPTGDVVMPQLGVGFWQVDDDITPGLVEESLKLGYRSIDTAKIYGNEGGVGRGLAASGVPREDIFLTTKVWNSDQGHDATLKAFDASLELLGTDYVDLYLIHWPVPSRDLYVDTWAAMRELREQGRAKAIGVCNFNVDHLERLHAEFGEYPSINQVEIHPYLTQQALRDFHAEHGIVTEDWSPLAARLHLIDNPVVTGIAAEVGATPAQVVYRWHLQIGSVVIPRSTKPERLAENLAVLDLELTQAQMDSLSALNRNERTGPDPATFDRA